MSVYYSRCITGTGTTAYPRPICGPGDSRTTGPAYRGKVAECPIIRGTFAYRGFSDTLQLCLP